MGARSYRKKWSAVCIGLLMLSVCASIIPGSAGTPSKDVAVQSERTMVAASPHTIPVTVTLYEKTGLRTYTTQMKESDIQAILQEASALRLAMQRSPQTEATQQLQTQFITSLLTYQAIPQEAKDQVLASLMQPPALRSRHTSASPLSGTSSEGTEWLCSFASAGEGASLPIIILPRFIPFILSPIPRVFMRWSATDAVTSCGALRSNNGFVAMGQQQGIALGFWGIGFTVHLPPLMNSYGLFGYALYSHVTAEYMEYYPPNSPPEIIETDPADGQQMVSLSTTDLRFSIKDVDGDLMSYNVTTSPDIGSGSGGLKPGGLYSIPISGLESFTQYTWHIQVSDSKDTIEKTLTFTTEPVAPVISNPSPADRERYVPTDLQQLQFTLKDFQGDAMNYTVETSPFIGSGSGTGVHNGTYTVAVSGLENSTTYRWYINATDGTHWTRTTFRFDTGFPANFDPFEHGWHYRKQITIGHTNIPQDLANFPVLVSTVDTDLQEKAQPNGDDILFMNNTGFATRLNYEIEQYDGSLGKLIAWVNITQLSSNEDTTFYMYYGNPTTLSQQNPEKTWDSNYVAVWHFGETSGTNIADSTSNHFNATANTYTPVTAGRIGNGRYFDMTNSEIYVGTPSAFGGMTSYTVESWANPKSISGEHRIFDRSGQSNPNTILFYQNNALSYLTTNNVDSSSYINAFTVDSWTHAVGVFTGSSGESAVYKNGVKGMPITTTQANPSAGNFTIYIGRACLSSSSSYRWYGTLDELRFSKIARTSAWISVSYQNQDNPTGFMNIGPEEPGP